MPPAAPPAIAPNPAPMRPLVSGSAAAASAARPSARCGGSVQFLSPPLRHVEQARGRHHRHRQRPGGEADPGLRQRDGHRIGRRQPEQRPAAKDEGVDPFDEVCGASASVSRVAGPPPRTSTAIVTGTIGKDNGNAGARAVVVRVPDAQSGDVGETVAFIGHCATVPQSGGDNQPVP